MIPPELTELAPTLYSWNPRIASEELEKNEVLSGGQSKPHGSSYLMNRTSRSWSRPTNDFIVRKRPKRSWISLF